METEKILEIFQWFIEAFIHKEKKEISSDEIYSYAKKYIRTEKMSKIEIDNILHYLYTHGKLGLNTYPDGSIYYGLSALGQCSSIIYDLIQ